MPVKAEIQVLVKLQYEVFRMHQKINSFADISPKVSLDFKQCCKNNGSLTIIIVTILHSMTIYIKRMSACF